LATQTIALSCIHFIAAVPCLQQTFAGALRGLSENAGNGFVAPDGTVSVFETVN
jgi:hypothetical protein